MITLPWSKPTYRQPDAVKGLVSLQFQVNGQASACVVHDVDLDRPHQVTYIEVTLDAQGGVEVDVFARRMTKKAVVDGRSAPALIAISDTETSNLCHFLDISLNPEDILAQAFKH